MVSLVFSSIFESTLPTGTIVSAAVFFLLKSVQKSAQSAHVFSNAFLEKSKTYLDVKICGKY